MAQGLTFTVVFKAMSMNYGESLGNISELKKLNSGDHTYTYISRQALRYELYKSMKENFEMDNDLNFNNDNNPLHPGNDVIQYRTEVTAANCIEADLFGYMKTERQRGALIRPAVVRITPGIALEPYLNDIEFASNKNFADRVESNPNLFQFEHQLGLYTYTIAIDLDRVGVDENDEEEEVSSDEKYNRVAMVLDATQLLNREIKGRIENMNPLFVIGGVYPVKNPFFLGRIKTEYDQDNKGYRINTNCLASVLGLQYSLNGDNQSVGEGTQLGYIGGFWVNENDINELANNKQAEHSISSFFNHLKNSVGDYYGVNQG